MNVVIFLVTLFFSDGSYGVSAVTKPASATAVAECSTLAKGAPDYFVGKAVGNRAVTGVDAKCIVVNRRDNT